MFGLRTSQGYIDGEIGVEENQEKMCKWLWVWQSLTLKCFDRVFSLKISPYNFVGNEGIYNVGKEFGKALFIFVKQRVS